MILIVYDTAECKFFKKFFFNAFSVVFQLFICHAFI